MLDKTAVRSLAEIRDAYSKMEAKVRKDVSYVSRYTYQRIAKFMPVATGQALEQERAPLHVFRWVVNGHDVGDRILRGQVMLAVKRKVRLGKDRLSDAWPRDFEKTAAMSGYLAAPEVQQALAELRAPPLPEALDAHVYQRAIDTARAQRRPSRRLAAAPPPPAPRVASADELRLLRELLARLGG